MHTTRTKVAVIIGAGPAGLTAAYELLRQSVDIKPIIFEASDAIGGIAKTVNYKGNRMDMGGHRFFSKSERVMRWWENILPLQRLPEGGVDLTYHNKTTTLAPAGTGADPGKDEKVMLLRPRLSRSFFLGTFFDYPVALNKNTILNLGFVRIAKIGFSYLKVRLLPRRQEKSLEDFFINRFGRELYLTFFKDYTEKVWGVACTDIDPEWGAQRIKGLSMTKALLNIIRKQPETSLIQQFLYPKLGPGQMWEETARLIIEQGGEIHLNHEVVGLRRAGNRVTEALVCNVTSGEMRRQSGDYFFSTMPVKELIEGLDPPAPEDVLTVARGLLYRDFITVGLLLRKLKVRPKGASPGALISDNWIYIQEPEVKLGRLQIFNNWSPSLVRDPGTVWLGLEYFCNEGDELWSKSDEEFMRFATHELAQIGIIDLEDVLDRTIVRVKKAYPAYFGSYAQFDTIRRFTDSIDNLYLVGRNGMHKYNNQDHSMLSAMVAVENILSGAKDKDNIWAVNPEEEYHEST